MIGRWQLAGRVPPRNDWTQPARCPVWTLNGRTWPSESSGHCPLAGRGHLTGPANLGALALFSLVVQCPTPPMATSRKVSAKKASKKAANELAAAPPKASQEPEFGGFPKDGIAFLAELALNNDRDWFKANQARYEQSVRDPALAFVRAMAPHLAKMTKHFVAADKKV